MYYLDVKNLLSSAGWTSFSFTVKHHQGPPLQPEICPRLLMRTMMLKGILLVPTWLPLLMCQIELHYMRFES